MVRYHRVSEDKRYHRLVVPSTTQPGPDGEPAPPEPGWIQVPRKLTNAGMEHVRKAAFYHQIDPSSGESVHKIYPQEMQAALLRVALLDGRTTTNLTELDAAGREIPVRFTEDWIDTQLDPDDGAAMEDELGRLYAGQLDLVSADPNAAASSSGSATIPDGNGTPATRSSSAVAVSPWTDPTIPQRPR